ncbi:hypothetical protein TNCV_4708131 [Trichonephila clavipes]|nr:hypothetical protein TNCV_4708131 [Trichonephila clavipes]
MLDHRIFPRLHHQLRKTRSFLVTRHDARERSALHSTSLEESIWNDVSDRPEPSTRAVSHHLNVDHQTICRVSNENRLLLFHYQPVQALYTACNILRLQCALQLDFIAHKLNRYEQLL